MRITLEDRFMARQSLLTALVLGLGSTRMVCSDRCTDRSRCFGSGQSRPTALSPARHRGSSRGWSSASCSRILVAPRRFVICQDTITMVLYTMLAGTLTLHRTIKPTCARIFPRRRPQLSSALGAAALKVLWRCRRHLRRPKVWGG